MTRRSVLQALALGALVTLMSLAASASPSWKGDWAVEGPFALEIDATGFSMPTALAFVPEPGADRLDPRYFVVELHGRVTAVTNDGTLVEFASVPALNPDVPLPDPSAQVGAAGICLDAERGYVFVTFVSQREGGTLGNRLIRFETKPGTFGVEYSDVSEMASVLGTVQSAPSHQIGGCAVDQGRLFVGIGDGGDIAAASRKGDLLGKIVAMNLMGEPLDTNPFSADESEAARYVYAMGFRNPFAIGVYNGLVTVIDNGLSIDRLIVAQPGVDYLWDGTDASIAASAAAIFDPSAGAVHLDRANPNGYLGDGIHYSASSQEEGISGLWFLPFDFTFGHTTGKPQQVVQYTGEGYSPVTAVAQGPDGIYFTPLASGSSGASSVMKVVHRPNAPHPFVIDRPVTDLFTQFGCITCHERDATGGDVGPSLDYFHEENRERVLSMIESDGFEEMLRELDARADEPFVSTRDARAEVLSVSGLTRLLAYVKHKAMEPRFSDPDSVMPQLGLTEDEAAAVASELAAPWEIRVSEVERALRRWFPIPETRVGDIVVGAILGALLISIGVTILSVARRFAPKAGANQEVRRRGWSRGAGRT